MDIRVVSSGAKWKPSRIPNTRKGHYVNFINNLIRKYQWSKYEKIILLYFNPEHIGMKCKYEMELLENGKTREIQTYEIDALFEFNIYATVYILRGCATSAARQCTGLLRTINEPSPENNGSADLAEFLSSPKFIDALSKSFNFRIPLTFEKLQKTVQQLAKYVPAKISENHYEKVSHASSRFHHFEEVVIRSSLGQDFISEANLDGAIDFGSKFWNDLSTTGNDHFEELAKEIFKSRYSRGLQDGTIKLKKTS